jgi:hypothetical protein
VTPLRVLDVVLWMRHRSDHRGYRCPCVIGDVTAKMSVLFEPEPRQWGLRGDPYLWRHMRRCLADQDLPPSTEQVTSLLYRTFGELADVDLARTDLDKEPGDSVRREQYDHGGMSGGYISLITWRDRLMPLLTERAEDRLRSRSPGA